MKLDPLDVRILQLLQEDARLSFREIAERLGSTTPTVSARVKALEDIGLIRGYRAQLDHGVLGGASYVLIVSVQPASAHAALADVQAMPGVIGAHLTPGGRIVSHLRLRPPALSLQHLHDAIVRLPGLVTYDAAEVIAGHEHNPIGELPENVEVPCHQCRGPIYGEPVKGKFAERTHVFCCRGCLGTFRDRYQALQAAAATAKPGPKPRFTAEPSRPQHRR